MKHVSHSWSNDQETALAFSSNPDHPNKERLLIRYPINNFKESFAVDVVMDNLSDDQISEFLKDAKLKHAMEQYASESEVISFDDFEIHLKYIEHYH